LGENSIPFDEEKRLCYVAMTRAKSELLMTHRKNVWVFTFEGLKSIERDRSRFLDVLQKNKNDTSSIELDFSISDHSTKSITTWGHKSKKGTTNKANEIKSWSSNAKIRQFGTSWTPPTSKFTGTASVYKSIPNKSLIGIKSEKVNKHGTSPRRPLAPIMARSSVSTTGNKVKSTSQPENVDPSISYETMETRSLLSARKNGVASPSPTQAHIPHPTPPLVDSSWFFPIGSKVRHKHFGDGIVLPSASDMANRSMTVLVEFHNGEKLAFPVQTTDLSPITL
jgi:hypothetical protein